LLQRSLNYTKRTLRTGANWPPSGPSIVQSLYNKRFIIKDVGKKSAGGDGTRRNPGANVDKYFHTNGSVTGQIAEI
jgi:hypothetical protein